MNQKPSRPAIAAIVALCLGLPLPAWADGDDDRDDHELARRLHQRGEIESLSDVMRAVERRAPGDIVAIELVRHGKRWVYRFQVVARDGRRSVVEIDAGAPALASGDGDE